ncbi:uncharacterized protein LOC144102101 [Amblyomma americanum]
MTRNFSFNGQWPGHMEHSVLKICSDPADEIKIRGGRSHGCLQLPGEPSVDIGAGTKPSTGTDFALPDTSLALFAHSPEVCVIPTWVVCGASHRHRHCRRAGGTKAWR